MWIGNALIVGSFQEIQNVECDVCERCKMVIRMKVKLDILDRLENETGFVRLVLTSGEIVYGKPDCICWAEDEDGDDTIKEIMFEPFFNRCGINKFYRLEDVDSYEPCEEGDIPPYQRG